MSFSGFLDSPTGGVMESDFAARVIYGPPQFPNMPGFVQAQHPAAVWEPIFVPPVVTPVRVFPSGDTIRGGTTLVLYGNYFLDPTYDTTFLADPLVTVLPSGWTTANTGSGAVATSTTGLVLDTGLTAGSVASVVSDALFTRGEFLIDVEPLSPQTATTAVNIVVLEVRSGAGDRARVRLSRGVLADRATLVATGEVVPAAGPTIHGGTTTVSAGPGRPVTLRVVRHGATVWGFVGEMALFTVTTFDTTEGAVHLRAENAVVASGRAQARVSNFRVRSHASVNGRLLLNKVDISAERFTGEVPAAPLTELGAGDINVFGLFGEVLGVGQFLYTLPTERTVGRDSVRTLLTVQDRALTDETTRSTR